jgi:hypothetical protein
VSFAPNRARLRSVSLSSLEVGHGFISAGTLVSVSVSLYSCHLSLRLVRARIRDLTPSLSAASRASAVKRDCPKGKM